MISTKLTSLLRSGNWICFCISKWMDTYNFVVVKISSLECVRDFFVVEIVLLKTVPGEKHERKFTQF